MLKINVFWEMKRERVFLQNVEKTLLIHTNLRQYTIHLTVPNDFLLGSGSTSQNGSWNTEAISASQMLSKKPDPLWQDIPHQKESIADFFFYPNMPSTAFF